MPATTGFSKFVFFNFLELNVYKHIKNKKRRPLFNKIFPLSFFFFFQKTIQSDICQGQLAIFC